jgi:alpha-beta hydrolase superfamily lysophospholipase
MLTQERTFEGAKGLRIFYRYWAPEGRPPRAIILLIHGYAEHAGRYLALAEFLTGRGYGIYAPDLRSHGRSQGEKALIDSMDYMLEDLRKLLDIAQGEHPGLKTFVIGHSMGGLLATCFAILNQVRLAGVVLSGAGLMPGAGVSPLLKFVSRVLAVVAPRLPLQELDSAWLSHDPQIARDYDTDPLNYRGKVMARTAAEMLRKADWALPRIPEIRIPLLCLHGGEDKLVSPEAGRYVYEHAGSSDKTLHIFDGLYHEVFNEIGKEDIYKLVADWLDARC